jgi:uncharacterized repeat protein (TIGR01451 family)
LQEALMMRIPMDRCVALALFGCIPAVGCGAADGPGGDATARSQAAVTSPGDYTVTLEAGGTVTQGARTPYTASVTNNTANSTLTIITVLDFPGATINLVPAGCTRIGPELVRCAAPAVPTGTTLTYATAITPNEAGPATYGASVDTFDPTTGVTSGPANFVDDTPFVTPAPTDVQVTGSSNQGSPPLGSQYTYTFQVKNNGPFATFGGVSFTDSLPLALTFAGVTTDTGACAGGASVSCALGDLAVGAQATIRVDVQAPTTAQTVTNTASAVISGPQTDRNPANNAVAVTVTAK